ncbi:MAG: valine--tRNA ligase [Patescibacteria group bacterium]|nr:valine--tRNA ligase [Patescibacteria group bacterium]
MSEIPKAYNSQEVEDKIYEKWRESGFFNPDNLNLPKDKKNDKENRFVISMPPPNATGVLHLGHASMLAYQDLMIRYNRMDEKNVLWLPGTDHASIATQTKVEKIIAEKGQTKYDLGRENFLERVNKYVENSKNTIRKQTKKMGSSCDWDRERYTLDDGLSRAVKEVFVKMYNDKLIYRGDRIVNWCPRCESTLADDEVEHKDQKANLYYFKYQKDFPITIATTRPETKLGDTAVAVNPKDERYQKYIGQVFEIELGNGLHKIKIIADREVGMEFGTGALGVTPAHSMTDWEMAEKNNIEKIKIINEDGKMNASAGAGYKGLTVLEAREKFVKYLKKNNLIEKIEEVDQSLSVCYRCDTPIEPLPSKQWFVAVDQKITIKGNQYFQNKSLKEVALEVVNKSDEKNKDKIEIIPERFSKTYHNWMENLHDWCISRQIWFGHRMPVYYCFDCNLEKIKNNNLFKDRDGDEGFVTQLGTEDGKFIPAYEHLLRELEDGGKKIIDDDLEYFVDINPKKCPKCKSEKLFQNPDTLDTWFSSGLWTFSTLLNQDHKKYKTFEEWVANSPDLQNFHPTSVMETGYDILFFWIARMILMTTYTLGEVPFENVYLHGMVRDKQGRKMSKSLGNGIDPIEMIEKYGTDALRLSMIIGSSPGNDLRLFEEKIEGYRNFVNKLWNVSRYIIMNQESRIKNYEIDYENLTLADKWILEHLENLKYIVNNALENYQFSFAIDGEYGIRDFMWDKFADWYLEVSKVQGKNDVVLIYVLENLLKLCHPFIPFVTEQIWQEMGKEKLLMVEKWLKSKNEGIKLTQVNIDFNLIQGIISEIRRIKNENGISQKEKIDVVINYEIRKDLTQKDFDTIENNRNIIEALAVVKNLKIERKKEKPEGWIQFDCRVSVYVNIEDSIDKEKEAERIKKEIQEIEKYIKQIRSKLGNDNFIANAPADIVEKEREKYMESEEKKRKLEEKLKSLL